MAAYVISEVEVLDETLADRYRALAQSAIARYGGRYLVRGAAPDAVEGEWPPRRRLVIVEFPDLETARRWYASPEYAEALAVRRGALDRRLLFVEGLDWSGVHVAGAGGVASD
jgi:uncharacterized protein (DUF1330 family)